MDPLSSFERILARQLCPLSSNPHNSKENLRIFNLKIEFESHCLEIQKLQDLKLLSIPNPLLQVIGARSNKN
jgi:hypothetical protein